MICADRDIIIFNKHYDSASRRDLYNATRISGVSIFESRKSTADGGYHESADSVTIRIPISANVQNGKKYLSEVAYDNLSDADFENYWTIHCEDMILISELTFPDVNAPVIFSSDSVSEQEIEGLALSPGFQHDVVRIINYVDATKWGSKRIKHWMIGGA